MNLMAWAGYWFYNAANAGDRANLFASYGLLKDLPELEPPSGGSWIKHMFDWFWEFF